MLPAIAPTPSSPICTPPFALSPFVAVTSIQSEPAYIGQSGLDGALHPRPNFGIYVQCAPPFTCHPLFPLISAIPSWQCVDARRLPGLRFRQSLDRKSSSAKPRTHVARLREQKVPIWRAVRSLTAGGYVDVFLPERILDHTWIYQVSANYTSRGSTASPWSSVVSSSNLYHSSESQNA